MIRKPTASDLKEIAVALVTALLGPNTVGDSLPETCGDKKRCRIIHGGAEGTGAPRGKGNGSYRHGLHTREAIAERKAMRELIRSMRATAQAQSPLAIRRQRNSGVMKIASATNCPMAKAAVRGG